MARCICVLAPHEVEDFEARRIIPDCRSHRHITHVEARRLTGSGDEIDAWEMDAKTGQTKPRKLAKVVGEGFKRIKMNTDWELIKLDSDGYKVLQRVERGHHGIRHAPPVPHDRSLV